MIGKLGVLIAATLTLSAAGAQAEESWRFQVAPYAWATAIEGESGNSTFSSDIDVPFSDVWDNLDAALLLNIKAQKGRWGGSLDTVHMDLRPEIRGRLVDVDIAAKQTLISGSVFYTPANVEGLELHVGARYSDLDNSFRITTVGPGPASGRRTKLNLGDDWFEAFVGARYIYPITPKINLIAYGDVGGFSGESDSMHQLMLSAAYQFNERWSFIGGYRMFVVDYDKNNFAYDATSDGILIGAGYAF